MSYTPFSQLTLCSQDDILAEQSALPALVMLEGQPFQDEAGKKIALAKEQIRQELQDYLPEIFGSTMSIYGYGAAYGYNDWLADIGYSYNQLDAILDQIINSEELKRTAVAYTIRLLLQDGIARYLAYNQAESDALRTIYDFWHGTTGTRAEARHDGECFKRMAVAKRMLKFDLSLTGVLVDQDRVRTAKTIYRV